VTNLLVQVPTRSRPRSNVEDRRLGESGAEVRNPIRPSRCSLLIEPHACVAFNSKLEAELGYISFISFAALHFHQRRISPRVRIFRQGLGPHSGHPQARFFNSTLTRLRGVFWTVRRRNNYTLLVPQLRLNPSIASHVPTTTARQLISGWGSERCLRSRLDWSDRCAAGPLTIREVLFRPQPLAGDTRT